jgi:hypothetical protein
LRNYQAISVEEGLRTNRFHFLALLRGGRAERRHKSRVQDAARRWRSSNCRRSLVGERLASKIERLPKFCPVERPSVDVLWMDWQLRNAIPHYPMHLPWLFNLPKRILPLTSSLLLRLFELLRYGASDAFLFLLIARAG